MHAATRSRLVDDPSSRGLAARERRVGDAVIDVGWSNALRKANGDGKPELNTVDASVLGLPFGIAFDPPGPRPTHAYVANTDSVVRFAYTEGDTRAQANVE